MEQRIQTGWLLDFYGPLLTERQQAMLRLYCEEDLSLAEIAAQEGISRQAVHAAVKKGAEQLAAYEAQLGLLTRFRRQHQAIGQAVAALAEIVPMDEHQQAFAAVRRELAAFLAEEEETDGV